MRKSGKPFVPINVAFHPKGDMPLNTASYHHPFHRVGVEAHEHRERIGDGLHMHREGMGNGLHMHREGMGHMLNMHRSTAHMRFYR